METFSFILLKWGTNRFDSLLFYIPLALLLILWGSGKLISFIKKRIAERREMLQLFEQNELQNKENLLVPV